MASGVLELPEEVLYADLVGIIMILGHRKHLAPIGEWCEWTKADEIKQALSMIM